MLKFTNEEVAKKFEIPEEFNKDTQIRVPTLQYSGLLTEITPEVADQLIKEKYNRIKPVGKK